MQIHIISCGFGLSFLLEYPQGLYLIDSGSPGMQAGVIDKMKALGRSDLRLIWITHSHYDHYGSAAATREQTGALIGIHPADAPTMTGGLSQLGTDWSNPGGSVRRFLLYHSSNGFLLECGRLSGRTETSGVSWITHMLRTS